MINASTLALLNAGSVPMCGSRLRRFGWPYVFEIKPPSALLILDPSEDEIPLSGGGGCFAFLFATGLNNSGSSSVPSSEAVWNNWQSSMPFTEEELLRTRDLARDGAERVWVNMKQSIGSMVAPSSTHERTDRKAKIADIDIQGLEAKEDSMEL